MSQYMHRLHRHEKKTVFKKFLEFLPGFRTARLILITAMAVCGILYVVVGNMTTAKVYHLRDLEEALTELKTQNRQLELEVVKATAAESIASQVESLGLVPASNVAYLEGGDTHVAKR